jgi:hypothetical protein
MNFSQMKILIFSRELSQIGHRGQVLLNLLVTVMLPKMQVSNLSSSISMQIIPNTQQIPQFLDSQANSNSKIITLRT